MASPQPSGKAKPKHPDKPKQPANAQPSFTKLYWLRIVSGVLAGVAAFVFFSGTPVNFNNTSNGILIGIIGFLLTYYLARYALYRKVEREYFSKLYTTGIGGYIMLFIFTWILCFTAFSGSI